MSLLVERRYHATVSRRHGRGGAHSLEAGWPGLQEPAELPNQSPSRGSLRQGGEGAECGCRAKVSIGDAAAKWASTIGTVVCSTGCARADAPAQLRRAIAPVYYPAVPELAPKVTEYPWRSLEPVSRSVLRSWGELRRQLLTWPSGDQLQRSCSELVGSDLRISVRGLTTGEPAPPRPCALEFTLDASIRVRLELEPALVSAAVGRTLGQAPGLDNLSEEIDPALLGAIAAIVAEASRRSGIPTARCDRAPVPSGVALRLDATIVLDDCAYSAQLWVWPPHPARNRISAEPSLDGWRDVHVALPLVVGAALATPAELDSLGVGDAWLLGQGCWLGSGRALLIAPDGEQGVWVDLAREGRAVLLSEVGRLSVDPDPDGTGGAADMAKSDDKLTSTLTSAVLDAPVVVRVEIGAVSLTVREWTALNPGDVLELGRRVGDPVVLRIAGREVARGDLVDVEGETGVRIRELSQQAGK
jgi:flagellar motor switch/type III secretory pathway protein FliN